MLFLTVELAARVRARAAVEVTKRRATADDAANAIAGGDLVRKVRVTALGCCFCPAAAPARVRRRLLRFVLSRALVLAVVQLVHFEQLATAATAGLSAGVGHPPAPVIVLRDDHLRGVHIRSPILRWP